MDMVTEAPLLFTDAAALKVKGLLAEEENPNLMLRVFVSGGGCSGRLQYGFTFDDERGEKDTIVENLGVKLLIDPSSLELMAGSEIDYQEGPAGAQFVIRNNHAHTGGGCGSCSSSGGCSS